MKFKTKIIFLFTGISGFILLLLLLAIYYLTYRNAQNEYSQKLRERNKIAAQYYLEENETNALIYERIIREHYRSLPEEEEYVLPFDNKFLIAIRDSLNFNLTGKHLESLLNEQYIFHASKNKTYAQKLWREKNGVFVVTVGASDTYRDDKLVHLKRMLILGYVGFVFLIFLMSFFFSKRILAPIQELIKSMHTISVSDLSKRVQIKGKDELAILAATYNQLLDRLEKAFGQERRFIQNVSHELRTPLTSLIGEADITLQRDRSTSEYKDCLENVLEAAQNIQHITDQLLKLSQINEQFFHQQKTPISPAELTEMIKESFAENKEILLSCKFLNPKAQSMLINIDLFLLAIMNVVKNSIKYADGKSPAINISEGKKTLNISIKDEGIGIAKEDQDRIFEPFYRGSNTYHKEGFGIGLSFVKDIIDMHDGQIRVYSDLGKGTEFEIIIPKNFNQILIPI